jgi:hypothetical protein
MVALSHAAHRKKLHSIPRIFTVPQVVFLVDQYGPRESDLLLGFFTSSKTTVTNVFEKKIHIIPRDI